GPYSIKQRPGKRPRGPPDSYCKRVVAHPPGPLVRLAQAVDHCFCRYGNCRGAHTLDRTHGKEEPGNFDKSEQKYRRTVDSQACDQHRLRTHTVSRRTDRERGKREGCKHGRADQPDEETVLAVSGEQDRNKGRNKPDAEIAETNA